MFRSVEPLEIRQMLAVTALAGAGEHVNSNPVAVADVSPRRGTLPLPVTFDATASSDPDGDGLKFLWAFGDGSDHERGPVVQHTYITRGQFFARLVVFDGNGGKDTQFIRILAGESVPEPIIFLPGESSLYQAGDRIRFFGRVTDPEEGPLPDSALTWVLSLHRKGDSEVLDVIRGVNSGSFVVPASINGNANQFLRITLVARDSAGIVGRARVNLLPQLSDLRLNTNFTGLDVRVDGRRVDTPSIVSSVVGATRTVSAPRFQRVGNTIYEFSFWSDGGEATHDVRVPFGDTTLTAFYRVHSVDTNSFSTRRIR